MKKLVYFEIIDPVYKRFIYFAYGDPRAFEGFIRKKYSDKNYKLNDSAGAVSLTAPRKEFLDYWIFIKSESLKGRKAFWIAMVSHEALHTAVKILRDAGVEQTEGSEELTYYHEFIFRTCLEKLKV